LIAEKLRTFVYTAAYSFSISSGAEAR